MDLERLTEAYADEPYETERDADLHRALGKSKFAPWERDIERLLVRNAQYRDLLANGERVEPDYLAARDWLKHKHGVDLPLDETRVIVDAAIGGRLLVDPPKEETR